MTDGLTAEGRARRAVDAAGWSPQVLLAVGEVTVAAVQLRRGVLGALAAIGASPLSTDDTVSALIRRLRIYTLSELAPGGLQSGLVRWCDQVGLPAARTVAGALDRAEQACGPERDADPVPELVLVAGALMIATQDLLRLHVRA